MDFRRKLHAGTKLRMRLEQACCIMEALWIRETVCPFIFSHNFFFFQSGMPWLRERFC
ncbi:MAG: hypothetical protein K0S45_156 [Nitrospira sp.]|jgi:hypothetical protein|nr:hypothetical protein [Nitrospira sp.]